MDSPNPITHRTRQIYDKTKNHLMRCVTAVNVTGDERVTVNFEFSET